jgi:hypothetical protein
LAASVESVNGGRGCHATGFLQADGNDTVGRCDATHTEHLAPSRGHRRLAVLRLTRRPVRRTDIDRELRKLPEEEAGKTR